MINKLYILIAFTGLLSCTESNAVQKPNKLISQQEFKNILYEVNLLEGYLTNQNVNIPNIRNNSLGMYKSVIEKYGLTYEVYQENYAYYSQQSNFTDISTDVLNRLKEKEVELQNVPELKQMSFGEFKQLLKQDSFDVYFKNDTNNSLIIKLDTILTYYKANTDKLSIINIDSVSFESSIMRYKKDETLFKAMIEKIIKEVKIK